MGNSSSHLDWLKMLLDLPQEISTRQEQMLHFVLDETEVFICHYCGIPQVPQALEHTMVSMAALGCCIYGIYGGTGQARLKSISEGKVSLSFWEDASVSMSQKTHQLWHGYLNQLNRFRKVGWQCESVYGDVPEG